MPKKPIVPLCLGISIKWIFYFRHIHFHGIDNIDNHRVPTDFVTQHIRAQKTVTITKIRVRRELIKFADCVLAQHEILFTWSREAINPLNTTNELLKRAAEKRRTTSLPSVCPQKRLTDKKRMSH